MLLVCDNPLSAFNSPLSVKQQIKSLRMDGSDDSVSVWPSAKSDFYVISA